MQKLTKREQLAQKILRVEALLKKWRELWKKMPALEEGDKDKGEMQRNETCGAG